MEATESAKQHAILHLRDKLSWTSNVLWYNFRRQRSAKI